jgi:N-methylhydantoinase A/oxoprolinase/acetone carboxylase beta subunit
MKIGIDVGGTNTDAVLVDGTNIVAGIKVATTSDVGSGIKAALAGLLPALAGGRVSAIVIGTTHFTNALVQGVGLAPVAVLRIGAPSTLALPPLCDWPPRLADCIGDFRRIVGGGNDFDGRRIAPLDERAIAEAGRAIRARGLSSAAVSSVFSVVSPVDEQRAAEILRQEVPDLKVTLSSTIGRVGLLERENAAVMNASLVALSAQVVDSFKTAIAEIGLSVPFYVSQNDGTIMSADSVARFPVLTFASGPTNSMRGAALLSGLTDAIVVDIGGTTSDIGVIANGYPRESAVAVNIGGVRTNFRMPDLLSLGLGGGSRVRDQGIGPDSVGHHLTRDALVFGGATLTATDIVVAAGLATIGDPSLVRHLDPARIERGLDWIHATLDEAIDRVKTNAAPVPVVLVGGGAVLVSRPLRSASEIIVPDNAGVANAFGAALAQVGGEVDQVMLYGAHGRDDAIRQATGLARQRAADAGAVADTIEISEIEELPLAYLPGGAVRVRVKAVGELAEA